MDLIIKDLRYAARLLARRPALTLVAVTSLALGIGANTAIFSVVDKVLLRSLPVSEPDRLVTVYGRNDRGINSSFSYPTYRDIRDGNDVLSGLIASARTPLSFSYGAQTERIYGEVVTGNYFDVLGVTPLLGRTFLPDEDLTEGANPVAVLGHGFWIRRFAGDRDVLNRTMSINGHGFTIIGVAPPEFTGTKLGSIPDVYLPVMMQAAAMPKWPGVIAERRFSWLDVMGRLKPGVNREQAQTALTTLAAALERTYPDMVDPEIILEAASRGNISAVEDLSLPLLVLLATVALVLIIACANVANLLLARATGRTREIAVRLALGASRTRLIRQLLTESLLLSIAGGAMGLLTASWLADLLLSYRPAGGSFFLPQLEARLDGRVLAFTAGLSILTGLLFGMVPAFQASKPDLIEALKDETGTLTAGGRRALIRNALVVGQVALSVVVVVSAGLCLKSLGKLNAIDPGFDTRRVLVAPVDLALNGYTEPQGREFYRALLERTHALPGAESATLARIVPLGGSGMRLSLNVEGYTPQQGEIINFDFNVVGPDYFDTMRMPLIAGRGFTSRDDMGATDVVVINETAAHRYFGDRDPIGRHIVLDGMLDEPPQPLEIVGVVSDSKYRSLTEQSRQTMFLPYGQHYRPDLALLLRTSGDPRSQMAAVRREVQEMDPTLPVFGVRTLAEQKGASLFRERMAAMFLSSFGVLAMVLASIGIYGVMAFAVSRRTREIGIRMALGAQRADVLKLILTQGGLLVLTGVTVGTIAAFFATKLMREFLYDVTPSDLTIFLIVPLLLAVAALASCFLPARRATRVDPIVALRYE